MDVYGALKISFNIHIVLYSWCVLQYGPCAAASLHKRHFSHVFDIIFEPTATLGLTEICSIAIRALYIYIYIYYTVRFINPISHFNNTFIQILIFEIITYLIVTIFSNSCHFYLSVSILCAKQMY
jgi:hypothetical protein